MLTDQDFVALKAQSDVGDDSDLPLEDRRSRPLEAPLRVELAFGGLTVTVLGNARGRGWVTCGWVEGTGAKCIGVFELSRREQEKTPEAQEKPPGTLRVLVETLKATQDPDEIAALKELQGMLLSPSDAAEVKP